MAQDSPQLPCPTGKKPQDVTLGDTQCAPEQQAVAVQQCDGSPAQGTCGAWGVEGGARRSTDLLQPLEVLPQEPHGALGLGHAQVHHAVLEHPLDTVLLDVQLAALQALGVIQVGGRGHGDQLSAPCREHKPQGLSLAVEGSPGGAQGEPASGNTPFPAPRRMAVAQPVASVTELRGAGRYPTLLAKDAAELRATAKASPLTGCRGYSWGPSMVLEFESPLVSEGAAA